MPIFESDDEFSQKEFKRQQKALNKKCDRINEREREEEYAKFSRGEFNLHLDSDWSDDGGSLFAMGAS